MWEAILDGMSLGVLSLLVFGLCGLVGILIDFDHVVAYYCVPKWDLRFLHKPILVVSCLVLCGLGAYLGRLLLG